VRVDAAFATSAADARGVPRDGLPQIAVAGRSNVGKSSLINALARQRVARTSAAPGKTRLANFYRLTRGAAAPFYLVDLPGYGYARGQRRRAEPAFETMVAGYFGSGAPIAGVIHAIDARHPGLERDLAARDWLAAVAVPVVVVATKFDKLSRAERTRAHRELEHLLNSPVLPVSAVTGEGMDDLWKHLTRLLSQPRPSPRSPHRPSSSSPR
jgi:GTP-binding protein